MGFHDWIQRLAGTHLAKSIYEKMPHSLRSLPASLLGGSLRRERFGAAFHDEVEQVRRRLTMSRDEWTAQQILALRRVLVLARETVPAYRERLKHIDPPDIRTLDDWKAVPITDREEFRAEPERFTSDTVPASAKKHGVTSGSTGGAARITWEKEGLQRQYSPWWYPRLSRGYTLTSSLATFMGRQVVPADRVKPPFWIYNRAARQWMFSCFHTAPEMLTAICRQLQKIQVDYYNGYPSFLYLVAHHYRSLGLEPPSVRHAFTSSETLLPLQRQVIEEAFQCKVVEHYGAAEGSASYIQWSDDDHNLVLAQGHGFIEPGTDANAAPGTGMMITTNLINIAMPLINYRIGDVATEVPAEQAARYPAPAVARIDGRTDDFLIDSTGRRFGRLSVVVKTMSHIKEMQFYQDTAGRVDVRIVRDVGYQPADEQGVRDILRHYLGDHLTLNIVYVDRIERLPSGKFRLVLNKLPKA